MRKITLAPIAVFACLIAFAVATAVVATALLLEIVPLGDFRAVAGVVLAVVLAYASSFAVCRLWLCYAPLKEGPIPEGSREEFRYHVYLLFHLVLFHPLTRSLLLPVPLMRLVYIALGARLGDGTYSAGVILDPPLTQVGRNSIIGHDALLFSHVVEGAELSLAAIRIGDNVTVGAKAVIMPGVTIADGAIVGVGAVVSKGTQIGRGEVWSGVPARMLRVVPIDDGQRLTADM